ncbi:MAG: hypothetical protein JNK16_01760, partial [Phycisphaerales bacterium]|nr:hypothetical protein [Phycisphaerales bacterium]
MTFAKVCALPIRAAAYLACALFFLLPASALGAWGLRFEVSKDGVFWSPSAHAFAGE